jgi:hypothetical protein
MFAGLLTCCLLMDAGTAATVQVKPGNDPRQVEVVAALPADLAKQIPAGKLSQEQGEQWLQFLLVNGDKEENEAAIFGAYEHKGELLIFRPRYPLIYDQSYRAVFTPDRDKTQSAAYKVPPPPPVAAPVVTDVYPRADVLPANNLKFYIHFSRPMRGGKAIFEYIYLEDEEGNRLSAPWLDDEIWDDDNQRLLIFIHPGRIKWGLLLRQLFGPVLHPSRQYTLVISEGMLDKEGRKLGKEYRKVFRTTPEDRVRIELSNWKIIPPKAGTSEPALLTLKQPVDYRSLEKYLKIVDPTGKDVAGKIEIRKGETEWLFHPTTNWRPIPYQLVVDGELEDVAGNTPLRPFDLDLTEQQPPPQPLTLTFRPEVKK